MDTIKEMLSQPYYSPEILNQITDDIAPLILKDGPQDMSEYNFITVAAHACDVCETIKGRKNADFDMMPYEDIESDIAEAFKYWKFRGLFCSEDEQGNPSQDTMFMQLGGITAIPVSSEKIKDGQTQLVKKASCFFLFYFWNLFHQKLEDKYTFEFSINTIFIPMSHDFSFSQLGITIVSKDKTDEEHYFDALDFGENVCDEDDAGIYFAIKDTLNSFGITELFVPLSETYDESRFKIYKDTLIKYIPSGSENRVSVPEGVKSIKGSAFRDVSGITTVDLPESLEELQPVALGFMPDLTEVNISHNLKNAAILAFNESKIVKECTGMLIIGGWLIKCGSTDDIIKIPENVVNICCDAFDEGPKSAKEIILPSGIKEIYDETFDGFTELEKINLPEGLQRISSMAFSDCISLKEIIMPDTVDKLDEGAFQGCYSLKRVRLSDNITELNECTFVDCKNLEELYLPKNLRSIGEDGINVFAGCSSLKKIVFPEHLEYIGECAFQDCEELEEIVLPDSIKKIDNMAFAGCVKLKNVHLPDHEIEIAENAFEDTVWENEN